ncbi:MAG: hypothetical protein ABIH11_07065 [Candidatus Altiarchaeota archaeon]
MGKVVHHPRHPDARGKVVLQEDGEHLTIRFNEELLGANTHLLGRLHDATGHTALKKLGSDSVKKLVTVLDSERAHLEETGGNADEKRLVGRALDALVLHLHRIGEGHDLPNHLSSRHFFARESELHNLSVGDMRSRLSAFLSPTRIMDASNPAMHLRAIMTHRPQRSEEDSGFFYDSDIQCFVRDDVEPMLERDDLSARTVRRSISEGRVVTTLTTRSSHVIEFRDGSPVLTAIGGRNCEHLTLDRDGNTTPLLAEIQESIDIHDFGSSPGGRALASRLRHATEHMKWKEKHEAHEQYKRLWKSLGPDERAALETPDAIAGFMGPNLGEGVRRSIVDGMLSRSMSADDVRAVASAECVGMLAAAYSKEGYGVVADNYLDRLASAAPAEKALLGRRGFVEDLRSHLSKATGEDGLMGQVASRVNELVDYVADSSRHHGCRQVFTLHGVSKAYLGDKDMRLDVLEANLPQDERTRAFLIDTGMAASMITESSHREVLVETMSKTTPEIVDRIRGTLVEARLRDGSLTGFGRLVLFRDQESRNAVAACGTVARLGPLAGNAYLNAAVQSLHDKATIYADPDYIALLEASSDEAGQALVHGQHTLVNHWVTNREFWGSQEARAMCGAADYKVMKALIAAHDKWERLPDGFAQAGTALAQGNASEGEIAAWAKAAKGGLQSALMNQGCVANLMSMGSDPNTREPRTKALLSEMGDLVGEKVWSPTGRTSGRRRPRDGGENMGKAIVDTLADDETRRRLMGLPNEEALKNGFSLAVDEKARGRAYCVPAADALQHSEFMPPQMAAMYLGEAKEDLDEHEEASRGSMLRDKALLRLIAEKLPEGVAAHVVKMMGSIHFTRPEELKALLRDAEGPVIPDGLTVEQGGSLLSLQIDVPEGFPVADVKRAVATMCGAEAVAPTDYDGTPIPVTPDKMKSESVSTYMSHMSEKKNDMHFDHDGVGGHLEVVRQATETFTLLGPLGYGYSREDFDGRTEVYDSRTEVAQGLTEMRQLGIKFSYTPVVEMGGEGGKERRVVTTDPWTSYACQTGSSLILEDAQRICADTGSLPRAFTDGVLAGARRRAGNTEPAGPELQASFHGGMCELAQRVKPIEGSLKVDLLDWIRYGNTHAQVVMDALVADPTAPIAENLESNYYSKAEQLGKAVEGLRRVRNDYPIDAASLEPVVLTQTPEACAAFMKSLEPLADDERGKRPEPLHVIAATALVSPIVSAGADFTGVTGEVGKILQETTGNPLSMLVTGLKPLVEDGTVHDLETLGAYGHALARVTQVNASSQAMEMALTRITPRYEGTEALPPRSVAEECEVFCGYLGDFGPSNIPRLYETYRGIRMGAEPSEDAKAAGLTKTGDQGVRQLKALEARARKKLLGDDRSVQVESQLEADIMTSMLKIETSDWARGTTLADILEQLNAAIADGRVADVPKGYDRGVIRVDKKDAKAVAEFQFQPHAHEKLEDIREDVRAVTGKTVEEVVVEARTAIIQGAEAQVRALEDSLAQADPSEKGYAGRKKGCEMRIRRYRELAERVKDQDTVEGFVETVASWEGKKDDEVTTTHLRRVLISYGMSQKSDGGGKFRRAVESPLKDGIEDVNEFYEILLRKHILGPNDQVEGYLPLSKEAKKRAQQVVRQPTIEEELSRRENIAAAGKEEILVVPSRGLRGETCGYYSDACYTSVNGMLEGHPNIVPLTLVRGPETPSERIIGGVLVIEAQTAERRGLGGEVIPSEKVLVLRAVNPQETAIRALKADSFMEEFIDGYVVPTARKRGAMRILVAKSAAGASMTNRPSIADYVNGEGSPYESAEVIPLADEPPSTFNGYDIRGKCVLVRDLAKSA